MRGAEKCHEGSDIGDAISNRTQPPSTATETPPPAQSHSNPRPERQSHPSIHPSQQSHIPTASVHIQARCPVSGPQSRLHRHPPRLQKSFIHPSIHPSIQSHASSGRRTHSNPIWYQDKNDSDGTFSHGEKTDICSFVLLNPDASGSDIPSRLGKAKGVVDRRPEVDGCRRTT